MKFDFGSQLEIQYGCKAAILFLPISREAFELLVLTFETLLVYMRSKSGPVSEPI